MNNILDTIFTIAGALLAIVFVVLAPKLRAWISESMGEAEAERLTELVNVLVHSAQQTLWDKSGTERKAYVLEQLTKLGYEFTDYINALIEAAVFNMKKAEQ